MAKRRIKTDLDFEGNRIMNLGEPVDGSDAATKSYVDLGVDYLHKLWPKSNVISEGYVLSQIYCTRDASNQIVVGFNGTDIGKDATHGKCFIFAGSTSVQDIANAATRIYEDGMIVTRTIEILPGGKIGGFKVTSGGNSAGLSYEGDGKYFTFTPHLISQTIYGGGNVNDSVKVKLGMETHEIEAVYIMHSKKSTSGEGNVALYIDAYRNDKIVVGSTGLPSLDTAAWRAMNIGICCRYGTFAGLRPVVRKLETSATLSILDHTVVVDRTGTTRVTLPSDAEIGQVYEFIKHGSDSSLIIVSPDNNIADLNGNQWNLKEYNFSSRWRTAWIRMMFDGFHWYMSFNENYV